MGARASHARPSPRRPAPHHPPVSLGDAKKFIFGDYYDCFASPLALSPIWHPPEGRHALPSVHTHIIALRWWDRPAAMGAGPRRHGLITRAPPTNENHEMPVTGVRRAILVCFWSGLEKNNTARAAPGPAPAAVSDCGARVCVAAGLEGNHRSVLLRILLQGRRPSTMARRWTSEGEREANQNISGACCDSSFCPSPIRG